MLLSFCALEFVWLLVLSKDSFAVISFFPNCFWFSGNSRFDSWFGWYVLGCCFYMCDNNVFIFVNRNMSFLSDVSWSVSNLFLIITGYWFPLSLCTSENHSYREVIVFCFLFLHKFKRTSAPPILRSEYSPSKVEYALHFNASFIQFL